MGPASWDDRIRRAEELAELHGFARELLCFYREVLIFQKSLHSQLANTLDRDLVIDDGSCPMHGGSLTAHLPLLLAAFPDFLSFIRRVGSADLRESADRLSKETSEQLGLFLESYWKKQHMAGGTGENAALLFFPKAFLQAYAECLAEFHADGTTTEWNVEEGAGGVCPLCSSKPQLSVLRSEGDGARRALVCSVCATEWRFKRLCCPACGEESFSRLSYHTASEFPYIRVEVCETCNKYIKSVDLTAYGLAVPVVDEIAAVTLDLWAAEQGYEKIEMNLVGV